jgi:putative PIN family toxin of toxin-antitoxin system
MKPLVLDTNVLLDIFVFHDFRTLQLKHALLNHTLNPFATPKTLEEFADVLSRPLFALEKTAQEQLLEQWQSLAQILEDVSLTPSPWRCHDADDQVFLDLAYTARPSILLSKDHEVLRFATGAAKEFVMISADYNIVFKENP